MLKGKKVIVQDGNTEKALRKFKKIIQDSGLLKELQDRQQFVKPTIQRKIAKAQAVKRWKRYLKSQELPPRNY
jgi:small subunit ribosomal protein S21